MLLAASASTCVADMSIQATLAKQAAQPKRARIPAPAGAASEPPAQCQKLSLAEKAELGLKNDAEVSAMDAKDIRANPHVLNKLDARGPSGWIKEGVVAPEPSRLPGPLFLIR